MTLPATPRKVTRVAVGVLLRDDGRVLLADRPQGKPYAGYWEFPGGKIEPGEPVAVALARELHEELGLYIGPSFPWVTFEFDYPHAYVELQFRLVCRWRGTVRGREGQQLRFVDPAGELPQPLLPAAVPALRWLRLPPTATVITPAEVPQLAAESPPHGGTSPSLATGLTVVDADWRAGSARTAIAGLRTIRQGSGTWLLASGPGAHQAEGADGVVLESAEPVEPAPGAAGWRGAWVDSVDDVRSASGRGFDFLLVRSAALAGHLRTSPAALPAYLPETGRAEDPTSPERCMQRRWTDLRSVSGEQHACSCR